MILEELITARRGHVPLGNLARYDAEMESYLAEIDMRPFEEDELMEQCCIRMAQHGQPSASLPPLLCRKLNEPKEQWIERCYAHEVFSGDKIRQGDGKRANLTGFKQKDGRRHGGGGKTPSESLKTRAIQDTLAALAAT